MSAVDLTSAEMKRNTAVIGSGGALVVMGGGRVTDVGKSPNVTCNRCRFMNNKAAMGGALLATTSAVTWIAAYAFAIWYQIRPLICQKRCTLSTSRTDCVMR